MRPRAGTGAQRSRRLCPGRSGRSSGIIYDTRLYTRRPGANVPPSNAPVQLRAVGPICALRVAIRRSQWALNRNDFLDSRARQLQRVLGGAVAIFTPGYDGHRVGGTPIARVQQADSGPAVRPTAVNPPAASTAPIGDRGLPRQ